MLHNLLIYRIFMFCVFIKNVIFISMKIQLLQTESKSKRIKINIPYQETELRKQIKAIQGRWYHPEQKLWSVPNIDGALERLLSLLGPTCEIVKTDGRVSLPKFEMTARIHGQIEAMMTKLLLSGKRPSTIKAYRSEALHFFKFFEKQDIAQLTKEEIEAYMYQLKSKNEISDSKQNIIISAIKFYLEKVLGLPRTKYDLTRPKKRVALPDTLSEEDVLVLINVLNNLKHRCMLHLLYSSGLRREEVTKIYSGI